MACVCVLKISLAMACGMCTVYWQGHVCRSLSSGYSSPSSLQAAMVEDHWTDEHPEWIPIMKKEVEALYQDYKILYAEELDAVATAALPDKELNAFERYNAIKDDIYDNNELARYLREDRQPADVNPLIWWRDNAQRYPVLKHMAFDHLAAPASSSADERLFSKAGHKLDDDHYNTKADLAEAEQLVKSALEENIDIRLGDCKYLYSDKARLIHLRGRLVDSDDRSSSSDSFVSMD